VSKQRSGSEVVVLDCHVPGRP